MRSLRRQRAPARNNGGTRMDKQIEKEIKKAVEELKTGSKIQLELDKKNNCLKIWKLKLDKIEVKTK